MAVNSTNEFKYSTISAVASCILSVLAATFIMHRFDLADEPLVEESLAMHGANCNSYGFGIESVIVSPHPSIPAFSDQEVRLLKQLPKLKSVAIHGEDITDGGMLTLSECLSLETIDISHTSVTDEGLLRLASLPKLKKIILHKTMTTENGQEQLSKLRPDVLVLPSRGNTQSSGTAKKPAE